MTLSCFFGIKFNLFLLIILHFLDWKMLQCKEKEEKRRREEDRQKSDYREAYG